jgi:hypothetical protein
MVPVMTEAEFMESIRGLVALCQLRAFHARDSRGSWGTGFPDLVIVGPGGAIFREVKTGRGRLTGRQWDWGHALLGAGLDWAVWRPEDWPERIHEQLRRLAKV